MQAGQSWRTLDQARRAEFALPHPGLQELNGRRVVRSRNESGHWRISRGWPRRTYRRPHISGRARGSSVESLRPTGGDLTGRDVPEAYGAAIDEIVMRDWRLNKDTPLLVVATDPEGEVWPGDDLVWSTGCSHRMSDGRSTAKVRHPPIRRHSAPCVRVRGRSIPTRSRRRAEFRQRCVSRLISRDERGELLATVRHLRDVCRPSLHL